MTAPEPQAEPEADLYYCEAEPDMPVCECDDHFPNCRAEPEPELEL